MGFQLKLVVTSAVDRPVRAAILQAALLKWPFCRGPRDASAYAERTVFAPPELTSYLFDDDEKYEQAVAQNNEVEDGLAEWSREFPNVSFAIIDADCFGGNCVYRGFACRDGQLLPAGNAFNVLAGLLGHVGIQLPGPFDPLKRGFFAGVGSGGYS